MPRGKKKITRPGYVPHYDPSQDWIIETRITVNGRHLEPGMEVHLYDEEGRFTFRRQVTNPHANDGRGATWVDLFGGARKHETLRSFRPDRIKTVHRLVKRRPSKQTPKEASS